MRVHQCDTNTFKQHYHMVGVPCMVKRVTITVYEAIQTRLPQPDAVEVGALCIRNGNNKNQQQ